MVKDWDDSPYQRSEGCKHWATGISTECGSRSRVSVCWATRRETSERSPPLGGFSKVMLVTFKFRFPSQISLWQLPESLRRSSKQRSTCVVPWRPGCLQNNSGTHLPAQLCDITYYPNTLTFLSCIFATKLFVAIICCEAQTLERASHSWMLLGLYLSTQLACPLIHSNL